MGDDPRRFSDTATSAEDFPQRQVTKEREPTLNQRNRMKTSGDCGGVDGSREPLFPHRVREGGVAKRRRSSQPVGIHGPGMRQRLAKAWVLGGALKDYSPLVGSLFPAFDLSDSPLDGPTVLPDDLLEADMSIDVPPSNIATLEPNGNMHRSDDAATDGDPKRIDDYGINVDTGTNGFAAIDDGAGRTDAEGINEGVGISVTPPDESTFTNASVWLGDSGVQPFCDDEIKTFLIDNLPVRIGDLHETSHQSLQMMRHVGYINDPYGYPICHLGDLNIDGMFPSPGADGVGGLTTSISGHSENVAVSNGTAMYQLLPSFPRSPISLVERSLEFCSTENISDAGGLGTHGHAPDE